MDLEYKTEYDILKKKYQGKMSLEEKKITYELLDIEIETREKNITSYDSDGVTKLVTITIAYTTLLLSIGSFMNNSIKNNPMIISFYNMLIMISIILLLGYEFRKMLKIDKIRKENEQKINLEKEEIKKLKLEKLAIKNLAIEENNVFRL